MSKEMREQINKVKNWKQFLNESMENELPNSITIKLNDNGKFSNEFRYGNRSPLRQQKVVGWYGYGKEAGYTKQAQFSHNYMAAYQTGLQLENRKFYPLLKLEVKHLEYVYVYVMFDNKLSEDGSKGGGIRIIESPDFIGSDFSRYDGFVENINYGPGTLDADICFFPEFTPGTIDHRGYFKIV